MLTANFNKFKTFIFEKKKHPVILDYRNGFCRKA